jgi:hypothetical protein
VALPLPVTRSRQQLAARAALRSKARPGRTRERKDEATSGAASRICRGWWIITDGDARLDRAGRRRSRIRSRTNAAHTTRLAISERRVVGVPSSRRAVGRCGWQRDGTAHMQCDLTASYACLPVPSGLSSQPSSSLSNEEFNLTTSTVCVCISTHMSGSNSGTCCWRSPVLFCQL